jgi:hypothetical protein
MYRSASSHKDRIIIRYSEGGSLSPAPWTLCSSLCLGARSLGQLCGHPSQFKHPTKSLGVVVGVMVPGDESQVTIRARVAQNLKRMRIVHQVPGSLFDRGRRSATWAHQVLLAQAFGRGSHLCRGKKNKLQLLDQYNK